jgi:D-sedoheptulose 7-phosphate isomerase
MTHAQLYLAETAGIAGKLDSDQLETLVSHLHILRGKGGRLFIAGLGGSAANASHAANDFRKLCGIETYCLCDNIAELTARANDEGWKTIFDGALHGSKPQPKDALMILSVGGGSENVSFPLVAVMEYATSLGMTILSIVGRDGGYAKTYSTVCVIVPTVEASRVTPHTEAFQSVVLHCVVSHPKLQLNKTKW